MEKISSIIPSSARVQSVDLGSSHPIRPGQPSFGRPVGTSTLADKTRAESMLNEAEQRKIQDQEKMIKGLTDAFFMNQAKPASKVELANADAATTVAPAAVNVEGPKEATEGEDQPEFGRYIDVHV